MNKVELAYLAGVMDSDGYFTIKKSTYQVRVTKDSKNPVYFEKCGIKQVQPEAVSLIHQNFGGYYRIEKPSSKNGKPLHSISLSNLKAHVFIKAICPYLRIKKKQAKILLDLRKSLKEGKKGVGEKFSQKSRWGTMMMSQRTAVSPKQILHRENLIKEIKSLNDTRPWSYIPE